MATQGRAVDALTAQRRRYARDVAETAGVSDRRIADAFATVRREDFLPPGPWQIYATGGYVETRDADPAQIYRDVVIALDAAQGINNGQPSLHARCLDAVSPRPGDTVLHVGCGTGYYTALLATLVGPEGRVEALEIEPDLAEQAKTNLAPWPNVAVSGRSGAEGPLPPSDVVYVNAGATGPLKIWREALAPGGRLIFPLTPGWRYGGMLLVTRPARGADFDARFVCKAAFIPCVGAQSDGALEALASAFEDPSWEYVRSLRASGTAPDETSWFAGDGWWLSTEAL